MDVPAHDIVCNDAAIHAVCRDCNAEEEPPIERGQMVREGINDSVLCCHAGAGSSTEA